MITIITFARQDINDLMNFVSYSIQLMGKWHEFYKDIKAPGMLGTKIYATEGTSSPILRRSEEDRVKLCDMNT